MTEQTDGTIPVGSTKTSIGEKILPWVFRAPLIFMVLFFALPMAMTVVFSVFERTMFWMEPGFTLYSYENFFFSARLENFLKSMMYSLISVAICFVLGFPIAVFVRKSIPALPETGVVSDDVIRDNFTSIIKLLAIRHQSGRYQLKQYKTYLQNTS